MVTFGQSFKNFWKNYFNFTGTATRAEYWWMVLLGSILAAVWVIVTVVLAVVTGSFPADSHLDVWHWLMTFSGGLIVWLILSVVFFLAILIPSLSLEVRRIRDTGLITVLVWVVFVLDLLSNGSQSNLSDLFSLIALVVTILPTDALANTKFIGKNNR